MGIKAKKLIIACDGESASGKSTAAKLISKKYNLLLMNSGLLYRYSSYLILKYRPKNKIFFLKKKLKSLKYNKLIKYNLHTPEISEHSAKIAKILNVRNILKKYQKEFIKKNKNCVLEGRDASTKILPNSDIKFFFVCNLNIASKRRYSELKKRSKNLSFIEVKRALNKRNISDRNRLISPLQKHPDAVVVNTTKIDKKAMLAKMSVNVERALKLKYGI